MWNMRHIGDDDLKSLLSNIDVDEKYKHKVSVQDENINREEILQSHHLYNQEQSFTVHRKQKRTARCTGCKVILSTGTFVQKEAVSKIFQGGLMSKHRLWSI